MKKKAWKTIINKIVSWPTGLKLKQAKCTNPELKILLTQKSLFENPNLLLKLLYESGTVVEIKI